MKIKCRKIGITTKITIIILALILVSDLLIWFMACRKYEKSFTEQIQNSALSHAQCLASSLDGDTLDTLVPGMEQTSTWKETFDLLHTFAECSDELKYVYTLRRQNKKVLFLVDGDDTVKPEINAEYTNMTDIFETAFDGEAIYEPDFITDEWGTQMSAYAPIFNSKGQVAALLAVDIDVSLVTKELQAFKNNLIILLAAVAFIIICIMIIVRLRTAKSFNELNNKVCDLTDGSGDLTRRITITSGDELEVIADNFNKFIAQIRGLIAAVSETASAVYHSSDTTNQSVQLNTQAIGDINGGITNISASLEECTASVELVVENLDNTTKELRDYVHSIDEVNNLSKSANVNAEKAKSKALTHSRDAKEAIADITVNMKRISEEASKIEQIKDIAETISSIAEQTQILSLNAQIEAARAGEHGRGFAVVATDVEKLSYEITTAVDEIKRVNNRVLSAVNEMIESTRSITDFMAAKVLPDYDAFVGIGAEYGDSTKSISDTMRNLKEKSIRFEQIIDNIHMSIRDISATITDSSAAAQEITSSTETISLNMNELSVTSADSSQKSNRLNNTVNRYKYK